MGNKIGKQQIQTTQTLNELIKKSNEQTACGPDCQKQKKIRDLKTKYESAKKNITKGPENLAEARKNYFVYAFGDKYNNDFNEKLYTKEANDKVKMMEKQHSENVKVIQKELSDGDKIIGPLLKMITSICHSIYGPAAKQCYDITSNTTAVIDYITHHNATYLCRQMHVC